VPTFFDFDPKAGPNEGGTEVTVWGANFQRAPPVICRFETSDVATRYISTTAVACMSPPRTTKPKLVLSITVNRVETYTCTAPLCIDLSLQLNDFNFYGKRVFTALNPQQRRP
jgi:hypothetical protein